MTKIYLLKIKFTDYFFFGQGSEERGALGNSANYFLHSNLFPQQTGVRGFLRYLLLQINNVLFPSGGAIPEDAIEKVIELIGEGSQIVGADSGLIKSFSPLFVFQGDEPLFYRPNENIEQCSEHFNSVSLKKNPGKIYPFLQKKCSEAGTDACYLDGYIAKKGFTEGFTNSKGEFIPISKIFGTHIVSGNRINEVGNPDDESYYKQEFRLLRNGFSFGIWVEFNDKNKDFLPNNITNEFAVFGKERKEVAVSFTENIEMPDIKNYFVDYSPIGTKILLLSDAFVGEGFEDNCLMAVNQFTPFRFIHSSVKNTKDYAAVNEGRRSPKHEYLLARGSVLYLKENNTEFLRNDEFKKIGYNYFIQLKNN